MPDEKETNRATSRKYLPMSVINVLNLIPSLYDERSEEEDSCELNGIRNKWKNCLIPSCYKTVKTDNTKKQIPLQRIFETNIPNPLNERCSIKVSGVHQEPQDRRDGKK